VCVKLLNPAKLLSATDLVLSIFPYLTKINIGRMALALTVEAYHSNEGVVSTFDCVRIHIHDLSVSLKYWFGTFSRCL
jgi:hypothetical protein